MALQQPHAPALPTKFSLNAFWKLPFSQLLLLGGLLRLVLIVYGIYHDSQHALKYTDVDYFVFSDAVQYIVNPSVAGAAPADGPLARWLVQNYGITLGSPYDRATYRYTPLLALFLLPNALLHPLFGKFLFSAADLAVAALQYRILIKHTRISQEEAKRAVGLCWLFNPFVANIATRGSSESILGVMLLAFLSFLYDGRDFPAAAVFGLAVHFKIYPFIYASTVLAYFSSRNSWPNLAQLKFAAYSFGSFMVLNGVMYAIWGMPFVEHTYLYHLTRLDHRHNFSHYFYQIYLDASGPTSGHFNDSLTRNKITSLLKQLARSTFVPQLLLALGSGLLLTKSARAAEVKQRLRKSSSGSTEKALVRLDSDLALVMFIQTLIFTTFNRVCTSQYFMWFLWFLPLALYQARPALSWGKGLTMLGAWIAGQAAWLAVAYRLELLGRPVYLELWAVGVVFFGVNVALVSALIGHVS